MHDVVDVVDDVDGVDAVLVVVLVVVVVVVVVVGNPYGQYCGVGYRIELLVVTLTAAPH